MAVDVVLRKVICRYGFMFHEGIIFDLEILLLRIYLTKTTERKNIHQYCSHTKLETV